MRRLVNTVTASWQKDGGIVANPIGRLIQRALSRGEATASAARFEEPENTRSMFVNWAALPSVVADLSDDEIRSLPGWYYSVELRPGVLTKGEDFPSAGLTRAALDQLITARSSLLSVAFTRPHSTLWTA